MHKWYRFREDNDNEGERWFFYLPLSGEIVKKIEVCLEGDSEEYYELVEMEMTDDLRKYIDRANEDSNCGYMIPHNICSGHSLDDFNEEDFPQKDPFYKGQCWKD